MMIRTERLIMREYTAEDFSLFKSVYTDPEIMIYAYMDVYQSDDEISGYFNKVIKDNLKIENRNAYEFAVFEKQSGNYIGSADIDVQVKNAFGGYSEIGYFLLKDFWGKGYAAEIAARLIDYCFGELKLHKVYASCNAKNVQSEAVMKKAGMTKEGILRKIRFKGNEWHDEIRYSILTEEWFKESRSE